MPMVETWRTTMVHILWQFYRQQRKNDVALLLHPHRGCLLLADWTYLTGVYGAWGERSLGEELGDSQQISNAFSVTFIFFDRLQSHLFFGKQGFIARSIARRRKKLKFSMTSTHQKTYSVPFGENKKREVKKYPSPNTHKFKINFPYTQIILWEVTGLRLSTANILKCETKAVDRGLSMVLSWPYQPHC